MKKIILGIFILIIFPEISMAQQSNNIDNPTTYRGRPILYNQEDQKNLALNGGGIAYIPNGHGYDIMNVAESRPTEYQIKNARLLRSVQQGLIEIQGLYQQGFNPRSYKIYLSKIIPYNVYNFPQVERYNEAIKLIVFSIIRSDYNNIPISQKILDTEYELYRISPVDTAEVVVQKMISIHNFEKALQIGATGKVDVKAILTDKSNSVDEVNNIKESIRNKDVNAIKEYKSKYSNSVIEDFEKQIKNESK